MTMPTYFTPSQLQRIAELVAKENSRIGNVPGRVTDVELHHLGYKAEDYARNARAAVRQGPVARTG